MKGDFMAKRKMKRADIILIVSLLVVSLIALGILLFNREEGQSVTVEVDGERVATYPLSVDGEYVLNGGTNILVIEGGRAYMKEAECPDKTCVKKGGVKYSGESIVCLPNRVTVTVRGDGGVDLVS